MDQTLTCCDCSQQFPFTQGEQDFYQDKGLTPPRRCKDCRAAKKARQAAGGTRQPHSKSEQRRLAAQSDTLPGVHEENVAANGAADYL